MVPAPSLSRTARRRRLDDVPAPIVAKSRCLLWRRADAEAWAASRQRGAVEPPTNPRHFRDKMSATRIVLSSWSFAVGVEGLEPPTSSL